MLFNGQSSIFPPWRVDRRCISARERSGTNATSLQPERTFVISDSLSSLSRGGFIYDTRGDIVICRDARQRLALRFWRWFLISIIKISFLISIIKNLQKLKWNRKRYIKVTLITIKFSSNWIQNLKETYRFWCGNMYTNRFFFNEICLDDLSKSQYCRIRFNSFACILFYKVGILVP